MNIEINNEEYGRLIDLLFIADSVLTWHKSGEEPRIAPYEKIVQKIYALAGKTGQEGKVEYDPDLGKYFPASRLEESSEARKFLDEYADETFWHELIYRFTERELERQVGGFEKLQALKPDERFELETSLEEKYVKEFEEHGIERLEVVERFDTGGIAPKTSD